jgi:GPH family glycoside/pentoside/hexuronide:cation symporter
MKTSFTTTAEADRIPLREKMSYGTGMLTFHLTNQGVFSLIYVIYNVVLGIDVAFIGFLIGAARLWDAFTDPFMGKLSDNFRSRFGRRRPFIFLGGILTALFFMGFWWAPQQASELEIRIYLSIAILLLYTGLTIFAVPYFALGFEMSADGNERARVFAWREIIGRLVLFVIPWIFRITQAERFDTPLDGMRVVSVVAAAIIVTACTCTALFTQERYYKKLASKQLPVGFMTSVRMTLSNLSFLNLNAQFICQIVGSGLVNVMGSYLVIYYMFGGEKVQAATLMGMVGTTFAICSLISSAFLVRLLIPMGRVKAIKLLYLVAMLGSALKWFCYNPTYPYLALIPIILIGLADPAFWILTDSLTSDVCDEDELLHGTRREGLFGAVTGWIKKISLSIIAVFTGLVIASTGFDPALGGNQPTHTLTIMRALFSSVPILFDCLGLFLIFKYRLTDQRVLEIREELEKRRGTI